MRRALLIAVLSILAVASAALAVNLCSITGVVQNPDGSACANCTITANSIKQQTVSGQIIMPVVISTTTNATGTLSGFSLAQGLVVQITISTPSGTTGIPFTAIIPFASTVVFSNLAIQSNLTGTETLSNIGAPTTNVNFNNFTATSMACPAGNNQPEVESCPLGATTPSTGVFTTLTATTFNPTNLGSFTGKNITANSVGGPYALNDYNGLAQDTFNVEAYGALCDGSTDDTTAIQAAATAATGAVLLMPPSNCKINGTITLPSNTVMQCSGGQPYSCVITNASTTAPTVVLTGGGGVNGGGIIGMRATRSALAAQGSGADGFQIAKNNVIGNFVMSYDWADNNDNGFYLGGTSYSTIDHFISQTNANHGLFVTNGTGSGISQWLITNGLAQENGGDGIRIAAGTTTTTGALQVEGNNTFANCGHGIGLEGTATHIVTGVFLIGNILGEDNSNQIDITDAQTITITGNHLEGAGTQACGPSLGTSASHAAYAISMNMDVTRPNNINITGNHIFSSTYGGVNDNAVIDQISGNQIAATGASGGTNQQKAGVYFAVGGGKHILSSNEIEGNGVGVDNEGAAVDLTETGNFVFSNSSANEILGNTAAYASGNSGLVNSIPTMYNAAGGLFEGVTTGINVHITEDGCVFSSSTTCTKTLVAPAAFSNAFYTCTANDINAPNAVQIQAISGTSITFTEGGSTSDTVKFICVGN